MMIVGERDAFETGKKRAVASIVGHTRNTFCDTAACVLCNATQGTASRTAGCALCAFSAPWSKPKQEGWPAGKTEHLLQRPVRDRDWGVESI